MKISPVGQALEAMQTADAALMRAAEALDHPDWLADALTDLRRAHTVIEETDEFREDRSKLAEELEAATKRLEEFHAILDRKNAIILMLAMGDLSPEEVELSGTQQT